mgnify:CR=1 FL=1
MGNVLLLISDEHNPRYATPYGHPFIQTPNMERLAAMGTVYENAYCPSPLCMPSRSAFMAGRWVHEIQTYSNCNAAMEDFTYPTYGQVLAERGVHTVHIGKTHVYRPGEELGFSEMICPGDTAPPGDANHRRRPLAIRRGAAQRAARFGPREDPWGVDPLLIDEAIEWLTGAALTIGKPWVLAVNLNKPHFPHYVTPELWEMYPHGENLPEHGPDCDSAQHPYAQDLRAHFETAQFTEEQIRGLRRGYLGCVTFVDQQLGRLLDVLERTGQLANTNVLYTSDHGEMLGKFGMWWKCALYEDAVRVPLIVAGPDFDAPARVRTPVSLLDVQASLFHIMGVERPADWRGMPLPEIAADDPERVVFAEYHGHGTRSGAYMVRQGPWKLIYYAEAPHQLFNLEEDPEELHNLAEENVDRRRRLTGQLRLICDPERENRRAHAFEAKQFAHMASRGMYQEEES